MDIWNRRRPWSWKSAVGESDSFDMYNWRLQKPVAQLNTNWTWKNLLVSLVTIAVFVEYFNENVVQLWLRLHWRRRSLSGVPLRLLSLVWQVHFLPQTLQCILHSGEHHFEFTVIIRFTLLFCDYFECQKHSEFSILRWTRTAPSFVPSECNPRPNHLYVSMWIVNFPKFSLCRLANKTKNCMSHRAYFSPFLCRARVFSACRSKCIFLLLHAVAKSQPTLVVLWKFIVFYVCIYLWCREVDVETFMATFL